jgi:uncharacterized membrane protein
MKSSLKGALIAATVAGLFLAGSALAADEGKSEPNAGIKCSGINACKGHGACAGAGHDCAGKNACKGQGWEKVASPDECTDKGGKVVEN